jgi:hypothetical protein|nr:MAG TPA: baseplate protein [Caudoviricetes sp.]
MATSGSFGINGGGYNTTFGWSLNRQDIGGNYSVIDWWWDANWSGSVWIQVFRATISVNGSVVHSRGSGRVWGGRVASGQTTIWHNSDGTRNFGADGNAAIYAAQTNAWGSGSWDLPRIPRNAVILSAQDFSDEGNPTITYSNPAGHNMGILRAGIFKDDNYTPLADYRDIDKGGSSYTFHLTDSERQQIRNHTSGTNSLPARFFLWSNIAGNDSRPHIQKTVSIVNANPTFSNFAYADTNGTTKAITGNDQYIIQGKSTLRATITTANKAIPKKSATMQKYIGTINSQTKTANYSSNDTVNIDFGTINSNTNVALSVTAQDSRGNRTSVNKAVQVIPYDAPTVIARGERRNNFDKETKIHIEGLVSLLRIGNSNKNSVNSSNGVQYRYREQGTSNWIKDWTDLTSTMGANGVIGVADFWLNLNNIKSYEFEVQITDRLSTTKVNFIVGVGVPIMRIGLDGLIYNNEQPLRVSHVGEVIFSTTLDTPEKVQAIYGGIWVAFGQGRTIVGVDPTQAEFNAPNKTGGTKTVTLTIDQMPNHSHSSNGQNAPIPVNNTWINGSGKPRFVIHDNTYGGYEIGNYLVRAGDSQAHPNLQPYVTVYQWLRTS